MVKRIEINDQIVADPKICHGKPTFKGTRVMVWQVLELLKEGENTRGIVKAFPSLTPRSIKAALDYAASLTRGEKNIIISVQT